MNNNSDIIKKNTEQMLDETKADDAQFDEIIAETAMKFSECLTKMQDIGNRINNISRMLEERDKQIEDLREQMYDVKNEINKNGLEIENLRERMHESDLKNQYFDESWKFTTENEGTSIQVRGK
ncbi:MAG: hypothetical protein IJN05_03435 [Ruminococcus sp.]|nr:hypothetical protein [Ruminococcus sp.]